MNESFTVEKQFKNIGEEVIATDIYFEDKKEQNKSDKVEKKEDIIIQKNEKELEKIIVKTDEDNMIITLLDIEGNINSYENHGIRTVVNLFDMKDISTEYKKKQFFSMGYPYYIKTSQQYYVFSSDHGVFVLNKK